MKRIILTTALALLLLGASDARAQCDGPKRVAFQRGLTTAVLKGAIPASKAICYQLRARGGQKMIVHLAAPARGVLFTVIPDGYDVEPLAQDVATWEGVLDETGDYTISVHAPRAGGLAALRMTFARTSAECTCDTITCADTISCRCHSRSCRSGPDSSPCSACGSRCIACRRPPSRPEHQRSRCRQRRASPQRSLRLDHGQAPAAMAFAPTGVECCAACP